LKAIKGVEILMIENVISGTERPIASEGSEQKFSPNADQQETRLLETT
jgi:hypothetical protein